MWTFTKEGCPVPVPWVDVLVQQVDQVLCQFFVATLEVLSLTFVCLSWSL